MERLSDNAIDIINELHTERLDYNSEYLPLIDAARRLAHYEDAGLTPEEVKDMAENAEARLLTWFKSRYGFPVGELMGLLEAKQEGRVVVLPCKVGTTLYDVSEFVDRVPYPEMYEWHADYIGVGMSKDGKTIFDIDGVDFLYEDFGKSVFLTREEAETALEKGAQHETT